MDINSLQDLAENLYKLAPILCPIVLPKGFEDCINEGRRIPAKKINAKNCIFEGPGRLHRFLRFLGVPAGGGSKKQKAENRAAQDVQGCTLCGQAGTVALGDESGGREAGGCSALEDGSLYSTRSAKLDFKQRVVHVSSAQYACRLCRLVSNVGGYMQRAVNSADADLLEEVHQHMAAVNGAAGAGPAWALEVVNRAYSLQVLASSCVGGWRVVKEEAESLQEPQKPAKKHESAKRHSSLLHKVTRGIQKKHKKEGYTGSMGKEKGAKRKVVKRL